MSSPYMSENRFQTSAYGFTCLPGPQPDQDHEVFVHYPISTPTYSSSPSNLHSFVSPSLPESHLQGSGILGWDDMVDNSDVQNSIHGLSQLGKHNYDNGYPNRPWPNPQFGMKNSSWRELGQYLPLSKHGRPVSMRTHVGFNMTSLSGIRENHCFAPACGMAYFQQPQYCPGNNFTNQHPTSSYRDSTSLLTSACVSPSLSESSYTGYPATDGNEIEDNSDAQSNSYSTLEARSLRAENGMPYNSFTITGGLHRYQAAEIGQNLAVPDYDCTANVLNPYGHPVTELCNPFYSPDHDAFFEEGQLTSSSPNDYSGIGSHFQLSKTPEFEGNPFMDPVFSQDLSTGVDLHPDSTAAGQPSCEYDLVDFNLSLLADVPVPPAVLTARVHPNSPYCDVSIPITHTGRAVMPTTATTGSASSMSCFSAGPTTSSTVSPSVAPVETSHLNRPSRFSLPYYNASSRAASTHIAPRHPPASLRFPGSGTESTSTASTEESYYPNLAFDRLHQKTSPSRETLKPILPKAIDYYGNAESLGAIPFRNPSSNAPVSVTGPKLKYGISRCPWKGCFTITTRKNHKSNMRNHVRMTHEKPASPICEVCGRHYKKNDSLKKHLNLKHRFEFLEGERAVQKTKPDGTLFSTYQEVHDYVNKRKMKKV